MPGRFAETVGLDDSFGKKILQRIPTLARTWQGSDAGQVARPGGYARQECGALGVGQPVLIGQASTLGKPVLDKPSNEVGASHQTRLGRAKGRWASH